VTNTELPLRDDLPALWDRVADQMHSAGAEVLMTGTWGDQVLFPFPPGYLIDELRQFSWRTVISHLRCYPSWFEDVPASVLYKTIARRWLRQATRNIGLAIWRRLRRASAIERLLHPGFRRDVRSPDAPVPEWSNNLTAHGLSVSLEIRRRFQTLALESTTNSWLHYELESASPFLDQELVTFLVCTPGSTQTAAGTPKALLRSAMRGVVPDAILNRQDKGDYTSLMDASVLAGAQSVFNELRCGVAMELGFLAPDPFSGDLARLSARSNIGPDQAADALASLYAVECWFRQFFARS
jgi:hypothetical protein